MADDANGQQQTQENAGGETGKQTSITLPKEAFDSRLEQAGRSAAAELLKSLGANSPDDLKSILAEHAELKKSAEDAKAAQLSDAEKAAGETAKEREARAKAEARAEAAEAKLAEVQLSVAFGEAWSEANLRPQSREMAFAYLLSQGKLAAGADKAAVEAAVKELLANDPGLAEAAPSGSARAGLTGGADGKGGAASGKATASPFLQHARSVLGISE